MLTREERRVIRERCDRATPGPWVHGYDGDPEIEPETGHGVVAFGQGGVCQMDTLAHRYQGTCPDDMRGRTRDDQIANGSFIGCARHDIPALLDTIEELQTQIVTLAKGVAVAGGVELWHGVTGITRAHGGNKFTYTSTDPEGVTILVILDGPEAQVDVGESSVLAMEEGAESSAEVGGRG